jgi:hypothetical protein
MNTTIQSQKRDALKAHIEKDDLRPGICFPRLKTENPQLRQFVSTSLPVAQWATQHML